jgi:hypothetical protein
MAKTRPKGGSPPGRRGHGGSGPKGPPRTGGTGKGTHHTGGCMLAKAVGAIILAYLAAATGLTLVAGLT